MQILCYNATKDIKFFSSLRIKIFLNINIEKNFNLRNDGREIKYAMALILIK